MRRDRSRLTFVILLAVLAVLLLWVARPDAAIRADDAAAAAPVSPPAATDEQKPYTTESLRGRVVWLADALERRFGIDVDGDADRFVVALETAEGVLHPLVKDDRGRGFLLDERLRDIDMKLTVRRFPGSPFVQVIQVYTVKPDGEYLIDYWCDICAIPMYELKECECCQGPIRIRERPVSDEELFTDP